MKAGYLFLDLLSEWELTYLAGRIRAEEKTLLNEELLQHIIETPTLEGIWSLLEDSVFSPIRDKISGSKNIDLALNQLLSEAFNIVKPLKTFSKWTELLTLKYDFFNIKIGLKTKYSGLEKKPSLSRIGKIDPYRLWTAIFKEQYIDLPEVYAKAIEQAVREFSKDGDPQSIDLILDKTMFSYILTEVVDETDFIKKYFQIAADLFNLLTFLRLKVQDKSLSFLRRAIVDSRNGEKQFLSDLYNLPLPSIKTRLAERNYGDIMEQGIHEYEETGSLVLLEKLADDFLLDFVKIGKIVAFGPEPIVGYIVAKERDVKNINIVWQGKLFDFTKEKIREIIRKTYV